MGANPPTNRPIKSGFNYGRAIQSDELSEAYISDIKKFQKHFKDLDNDGDLAYYRIHHRLERVAFYRDGVKRNAVALTISFPEIEGADSARSIRYIIDENKIYSVSSSLKSKWYNEMAVEDRSREARSEVTKNTWRSKHRKELKTNSSEFSMFVNLLEQSSYSNKDANKIRIAIVEHLRNIAKKLKAQGKLNKSNLEANPFIKAYLKSRDPFLTKFIKTMKDNTKSLNSSGRSDAFGKLATEKSYKALDTIQKTFSLDQSVHFTDDINTPQTNSTSRQNIEATVKSLVFYEPSSIADEANKLSNREHHLRIAKELFLKMHYGFISNDSIKRNWKPESRLPLEQIQLTTSLNRSGTAQIIVFSKYMSGRALSIGVKNGQLELLASQRIKGGTEADENAYAPLDNSLYATNPGEDTTTLAKYAKARHDLDTCDTKFKVPKSDAGEKVIKAAVSDLAKANKAGKTIVLEPQLSQLAKARYLVSLLATYKHKKDKDLVFYNQVRDNISNVAKLHILSIMKQKSQSTEDSKILKTYSDISGITDFTSKIESLSKNKKNLKFKLMQVESTVKTNYLRSIEINFDAQETLEVFRDRVNKLNPEKEAEQKKIAMYQVAIDAIMKNPELASKFTSNSTRLSNTGADLEFYNALLSTAKANKSAIEKSLLREYRSLKLYLLSSS